MANKHKKSHDAHPAPPAGASSRQERAPSGKGRLPAENRKQGGSALGNLILHIHPRAVPEPALVLHRTWGLGGMGLVLFLVLAVTGVLLLFVHAPFPERAYASILYLQSEVPFGRLVRNVHHWSGNLLLIVAFCHMLRVLFTTAFTGVRRANWFIGLALFFLVLASDFTGYLLPWDQLAYWAVTIATGMLEYIPVIGPRLQEILRGGSEVGEGTLLNFHALHSMVLPITISALLPFHFWRVRKAGGIVFPRTALDASRERITYLPTIPHLSRRELTTSLVLLAAVLIVAIILDAPLEGPANPGLSPNPAKAPWYFAGFQELLLHFHPIFAVFVIPTLAIVTLVSVPFLATDLPEGVGVWFASGKGRRMARLVAAIALVATPPVIVFEEVYRRAAGVLAGAAPSLVTNGFSPFMAVVAVIALLYGIMKKIFAPSLTELIQSLIVFCLVLLTIFTITSIWFRGPGMVLAWPWATEAVNTLPR